MFIKHRKRPPQAALRVVASPVMISVWIKWGGTLMPGRPRTSRCRWSGTFKKRVVAEASKLGITVTQIAWCYDLDARRVSNWMNKFGSGFALVQVELTSDDCPCRIKLGHYDAVNERSMRRPGSIILTNTA